MIIGSAHNLKELNQKKDKMLIFYFYRQYLKSKKGIIF